MTIFIAHAQPDRDVAEALEKVLERRGLFVELEDGEMAMRPLQNMDACIILVSKDFVFSHQRLRFEKRALDAWAEGKLIVVKLDHNFAPVGLRDLPFVDASFEAKREFTWNDVANQAQDKMRAPAPASMSQSQSSAPGPQAPGAPRARARKKTDDAFGGQDASGDEPRGGSSVGFAILGIALALPGVFALAASFAIFLAGRIGPTPGTLGDLIAGIDAFGARAGLPPGVTPILYALAIALTFGVLALGIAGLIARGGRRAGAARAEESAPSSESETPEAVGGSAPDAVFFSYARANATFVLPVVEGVKKERQVWLDQNEIGLGDGWAGEIVRAIKTAHDVVVMCSVAAFESDHVKREVYLADRYKKRLLPVFIEEAQPPEDFEYFFAGVQFLKLHETPEGERPSAVLRALKIV
jgi:hypothetical protein